MATVNAKKKTLPTIELHEEQELLEINLHPDWEENPSKYIGVMVDKGDDLATPYEIDMYPKSLRGSHYSPDEGAFAFYNAFIKTFHQQPIGDGRPPLERRIQIQEFIYIDPDGNIHREQDINNPRIWGIEALYAYAEQHCPAAVAELPKFISHDHYEPLLAAVKETMTLIGAPVRELQVPWGVVKYPGNDSILIYPTESDPDDPNSVFRLRILAKKRHMKDVNAFVEAVNYELHHNNLYQGRCFNWNKGTISYFDPFEATNPENLVFARKVNTTLQNEVINTIIFREKARKMNKQLCSQKIVLTGKPGTGKTELTNVIAQNALRAGITVGYLQPGSDLSDLNKFSTFMAKNAPGIKVIEDIEAYMPDVEGMTQQQALEARSLILSIFDGAESKSVEMHTIVTTNFEEIISSAMLRSGRCDVLIRVEAPDREAFEKLVRMHIGQYLPDDIDFDALWAEIGNMSSSFLSNGLITKGQKYALKGDDNYKLTAEDFTDMIRSLRDQFDLYEDNERRENSRRKDTLSEAFIDTVKGAIADHEATSQLVH